MPEFVCRYKEPENRCTSQCFECRRHEQLMAAKKETPPKPPSKARPFAPSFSGLLFIVFLALHLTGVIHWSMWWVTAPLWIPFVIYPVPCINRLQGKT